MAKASYRLAAGTALGLTLGLCYGVPLAGTPSVGDTIKELRQARLARIMGRAPDASLAQQDTVDQQPTLPATKLLPEPAAGPDERTVPLSENTDVSAPQIPEVSVPEPAAGPEPQIDPPVTTSVATPGEASAGTTFRRNPIEPPIVDSDLWQEGIYAVELNNQEVSAGAIVMRAPNGVDLAVEVDVARDWRLVIDNDLIIELGGIPFYRITGIANADVEIDESRLVLSLTVGSGAFVQSDVDLGARTTPPAVRPGMGGFFDYDVLAVGGDESDERIDGLFELGAFGGFGVGLSSFQARDLSGDADLDRLETTFVHDMPEHRASLRIGDGLTTAGSFGPSVRFGGIQWATNFGTDPNFVTFPLPTIGGLSSQQSVVEIVTDNVSSVTTDVPAGPFSIGNIPVVTGAGELQVTVTDLLGRETTTTQPYYVSSQLLRPGLHDFAYEIGFERDNYAEESFDYGDPVATTTHRFGLTNALTFEGHAEAQPNRGTLIVGGAATLGRFGVVSGGVGGSADDDDGAGFFGQLAFDYSSRPFNAGIRSRYATQDYRQLGDSGRDSLEREDAVNVGISLGAFGRVGVLFTNRSFADEEDARTLTGSLSMPLPKGLAGPLSGGAVVINAAHQIDPDSETAITASLSLPLTPTRSLSAFAEHRPDSDRGRVQYRRTRGRSDLGLDYRVGAEYGDNIKRLDTRVDYRFTQTATSIEAVHDDGDNDIRGGLTGSLAMIDGKVGLTRPLGRAFGIVDLPGYPNVQVFLDNREAGRTDGAGRLILPSLRPFQANKVHLAMDDLPLDANIIAGEAVAVPFARSGVIVPVAIGGGYSATAVLVDQFGTPLPAGIVLTSADGRATAQVAREGLTQLDGLSDDTTRLATEVDDRRYACVVASRPENAGPFPDLGEIVCAWD